MLQFVSKDVEDRVDASSRNCRRCTIENCSQSQAIQLAHVFNRETSDRMLRGIEWGWRMKKDSLNLDTRNNIFFLGASIHQLYREKKWALLPDQDLLFQYFNDRKSRPLMRDSFPDIQGDTFNYTFIPMQEMEDIHIFHQSGEGETRCITIHTYPFEDFPVIRSHIHPKFVILHLGDVLRSGELAPKAQDALMTKYPWLVKLSELRRRWIAAVPAGAVTRKSYVGGADEDDNDHTATDPPPGVGIPNTPPHRIRPPSPPPVHPAYHTYASSSSEGCSVVVQKPQVRTGGKRAKRTADEIEDGPQRHHKIQLLTSSVLRLYEADSESPREWTNDMIQRWVDACYSDTIPTPQASTLPRPSSIFPVRGSARLASKRQKL